MSRHECTNYRLESIRIYSIDYYDLDLGETMILENSQNIMDAVIDRR